MNSTRRAFTLIEMVVALAVTAVIGYFFISIGRDFVRAWDNFGDAVSRETEARAALDLIARDFESAYFQIGKWVQRNDLRVLDTILPIMNTAGPVVGLAFSPRRPR